VFIAVWNFKLYISRQPLFNFKCGNIHCVTNNILRTRLSVCSKIVELEEELKVVGNNMKSLELSEQEVRYILA